MKINNENTNKIFFESDISRIVIYGNGKKLFTSDYGYFENYDIKPNDNGENKLSKTYNGGPVKITLKNPIKRAIKENLTRADNYILNYIAEYDRYTVRKALYIHCSEIAVEDLGDVLAMETDEEKNYLHACRLTFKHPAVFNRYHAEKIPCADNWTLPAGAKWGAHMSYGTEAAPHFETYDNAKLPTYLLTRRNLNPTERGVIKRWITIETISEGAQIIATERYYTKTEYSAERVRKMELAKAINASKALGSHTISHYDITALEKAGFEIVKKG